MVQMKVRPTAKLCAKRAAGPAAPHASKHTLQSGARVAETVALLTTAALPALAADAAGFPDVAFSASAVVGVAGLGTLLVATDPQNRRQKMAANTGGDEMASVKNYFETAGFDRWKKIYGETDDVSKVQKDIREGHAQTVDKVLTWLDSEGGVNGKSICDCGCGTGSLAIPLAQRGAAVYASDISSSMVREAEQRFKEATTGASNGAAPPVWEAKDLESVNGEYDIVTCLDVMIHYPQDKADGMIRHLAGLSTEKLIISFAPKTLAYSILKRIGELFPGPSKATRAYLHAEDDVERALGAAGFKVVKKEMTATNFYFSRLFEAVRS